MKVEFYRLGLTDAQRKITGFTQIIGSISLLIGFYKPSFAFFGALGLSLQMLFGIITRLKIGDPNILILPALFFSILNASIALLVYIHFDILY